MQKAQLRLYLFAGAASLAASGMFAVGCSDDAVTAATESDASTRPDATSTPRDASSATDAPTDEGDAQTSSDSGSDANADAGDGCTVIGVSEFALSVSQFTPNRAAGTVTPPLGQATTEAGAPLLDRFYLEFNQYDGPLNTPIALGTGDNANFPSCKQCVRVYEDFNPQGFTVGHVYFATSGTLTLERIAGTDGGNPLTATKGTFSNVKLEEVEPETEEGSILRGPYKRAASGKCLRLPSLAFEAPMAADGGADADAGGDGG
jgi:hypothetical protein